MRRHKWLRRIVILALLFLLGMMLLSPDRKKAKKTAEDVSAGDSDARTDAAEEENAGGGSEAAAQMDQTVVGWVIDKVAAGEIELSDENSVRQALEEAEREFEISLAAEDEERIVGFLQTLGNVGAEAEDFIGQAKQKYQQYSTELVEEANESINEAVEDAVTDAAESFFDSIKQTVSDFFTNLLAGNA